MEQRDAPAADEPICDGCARPVERRYRFCPWCAAPLRLKAVEFFPALGDRPGDGDALRVSVYRGPAVEDRHVRVSVWRRDGEAEAVLSLAEDDAARMASFVLRSVRGLEPEAVTEPLADAAATD